MITAFANKNQVSFIATHLLQKPLHFLVRNELSSLTGHCEFRYLFIGNRVTSDQMEKQCLLNHGFQMQKNTGIL